MPSDYQEQVWHDVPLKDTPLSASRLTHIEHGIKTHIHSDDFSLIDAWNSSTSYTDEVVAYQNNLWVALQPSVNVTPGTDSAIWHLINIETPGGAQAKSDAAKAFAIQRSNHTGTQTASTISDFNTAVRTNRLDQMAVPTSDVSLNSHKVTSVADPTNPQDAVTKAHLDNQKGVASGLAVLDSSGREVASPKLHATDHATGGADPITPTSIGAINVSEKGAASGVASLDSSGREVAPPKLHAADHATGGADPITPSSIGAVDTAGLGLVKSGTTLRRAASSTGYANLAALPAASTRTGELQRTDDGAIYESDGSAWQLVHDATGTFVPYLNGIKADGITDNAAVINALPNDTGRVRFPVGKVLCKSPVGTKKSTMVEGQTSGVPSDITAAGVSGLIFDPTTIISAQMAATVAANGTNWTFTVASGHGLVAGNKIVGSGFSNAAFNVQSTIASVTATTLVVTDSTVPVASDTGNLKYGHNATVAANGATWVFTVPAGHGLLAGSSFTASGFVNAGFNTYCDVASVTATTLTVNRTLVPAASDSGFINVHLFRAGPMNQFGPASGARDLWIECNSIPGSIACFSRSIQEMGGFDRVNIHNPMYRGVLIDSTDPVGDGKSALNYLLRDIRVIGSGSADTGYAGLQIIGSNVSVRGLDTIMCGGGGGVAPAATVAANGTNWVFTVAAGHRLAVGDSFAGSGFSNAAFNVTNVVASVTATTVTVTNTTIPVASDTGNIRYGQAATQILLDGCKSGTWERIHVEDSLDGVLIGSNTACSSIELSTITGNITCTNTVRIATPPSGTNAQIEIGNLMPNNSPNSLVDSQNGMTKTNGFSRMTTDPNGVVKFDSAASQLVGNLGSGTDKTISGAITTIASGSNGASLPQATINVASATNFTASGTILVTTAAGVQTVTYTGKTGTSFTGCSGGTGAMSTGGNVSQTSGTFSDLIFLSLPVGTYKVIGTGTVVPGASTTAIEMRIIAGTATANISGNRAVAFPISGVQPVSCTAFAIVKVTTAGSISLRFQATTAPATAKASTPTNAFADATGMVAF